MFDVIMRDRDQILYLCMMLVLYSITTGKLSYCTSLFSSRNKVLIPVLRSYGSSAVLHERPAYLVPGTPGFFYRTKVISSKICMDHTNAIIFVPLIN